MRDKEDYYEKRKALQQLQLDPETSKDEELKKEIIRRKHALEREAKQKGIISEAILRHFVEELDESYGRYWCSTDKKWKERKGPKQSRSKVKK